MEHKLTLTTNSLVSPADLEVASDFADQTQAVVSIKALGSALPDGKNLNVKQEDTFGMGGNFLNKSQ